MRRFQDQMAGIVQHFLLRLCRFTPENKYNGPVLFIQDTDCRIGKLFPANAPMGVCRMCPHRQYCVQHQYPLLRPFDQITVIRNITPQIIMKFLVNIDQRRRNINLRLYGKTESVGLSVSMVGILSQYYHLYFG